jgi:hypothetical protein
MVKAVAVVLKANRRRFIKTPVDLVGESGT